MEHLAILIVLIPLILAGFFAIWTVIEINRWYTARKAQLDAVEEFARRILAARRASED